MSLSKLAHNVRMVLFLSILFYLFVGPIWYIYIGVFSCILIYMLCVFFFYATSELNLVKGLLMITFRRTILALTA